MEFRIQNPGATMPLHVPVIVVPNTHEEQVNANITANGKLPLPWLYAEEPHDGVAIICGGGPSLMEQTGEIRELVRQGGRLFGLNGAAQWLVDHDFDVDYQVIIDAQEVTAGLVETLAANHVFASHVNPKTVGNLRPTLFHLNFDGVEDLLPPERVEAGGYTLVGGGVSVGITALVLAYVMGYRKLRLFGYDSSNRDGATHAYKQPWNEGIPDINVEWAGKTYNASVAMKLQAEAFPRFAHQLIEEGCEISVYGDGLLPAIWYQPPATERQKYQRMWMVPEYGRKAPGELGAQAFLDVVQPDGRVIDFGCGTGRGAKAIADAGHEVLLVDFTDNCRDKEVLHLPFAQRDLSEPMPFRAPYGYCTDVMEHIPPEQVDAVLANIMECAPSVWFQIATVDDSFGAVIGQRLHLSVHPWQWWHDKLSKFGRIVHVETSQSLCRFYVRKD